MINKVTFIVVIFGMMLAFGGCTSSPKYRNGSKKTAVWKKDGQTVLETYTGQASYYGDKFQGRPTASGAIYSHDKMTAAHKTLPFGTIVRVTNIKNNRSVVVTINDRGPFVRGRDIDLSRAAAEKIGMLNDGVTKVIIEVLEWGE